MAQDELSWIDLILICDTCGHRDKTTSPLDKRLSMRGARCAREWCQGHYIIIDERPYRKPEKTWQDSERDAIEAELFPLPTFDKAAYREECILAKKEEDEKAAYLAAHPIPKCPKCRSVLVHKERRGFKLGRALMGGYLAGSIGADDLVYKCETCGCTWK